MKCFFEPHRFGRIGALIWQFIDSNMPDSDLFFNDPVRWIITSSYEDRDQSGQNHIFGDHPGSHSKDRQSKAFLQMRAANPARQNRPKPHSQ